MMETAKRLYLLLPLLAVDTQQMLSSSSYDFSDCDVDIAVTSSLQLEELLLITVIQTQTHQGLHEPSPSCRRFSVLLRAFMSQTGILLQLLCHKAVIQSADVTSHRPDDAFKEEILNGDEVFHRVCS